MTAPRRKRVYAPKAFPEAAWQFMLARVMQIVGIPLVVALAAGMWVSQIKMTDDLATIKTSVALLELRTQSGSEDRYRGSQAAADFTLRDQRIADHEKRLDMIEQSLAVIGSGTKLRGRLED
jgi:hypothetical protein